MDNPVPQAASWHELLLTIADEADTLDDFDKAAQLQRTIFEVEINVARGKLVHRLVERLREETRAALAVLEAALDRCLIEDVRTRGVIAACDWLRARSRQPDGVDRFRRALDPPDRRQRYREAAAGLRLARERAV